MNTLIQFFKSILETSLFASAMIIIVLFIKAIAKDKISIKIISFLWTLVMLRLCVPGMLESPLHIDALFSESSEVEEEPVSLDYETSNEQDNYINAEFGSEPVNNLIVPLENGNAANDITASEPKEVSIWDKTVSFIKSVNLWIMFSTLWITGGIIVLLSAIKETIVFGSHVKSNSQPIKDKEILDMVNAHRRANKMKRQISVSICSSVYMPLTFGIFKPQIILPAHMVTEMKYEHISAIILHEMCHIKRKDILKSYAYIFAKALHWFNPLVWLSIKKIKEDTECACDQTALKLASKEQRVKYCESLLNAARFIKQSKIPQLVTSLYGNKSNLKERIIKMVRPQKKSRLAITTSLALALIMIIVCFTTACQPTPDDEIVKEKNEEALIEAIDDPSNLNDEYEYTSTWADSIANDTGTISVDIDAEVSVPNNGVLPIASVEPIDIPEQMVEIMMDVLGQGNSFSSMTTVKTKDEYEAEILELKKWLANPTGDLYEQRNSYPDKWEAYYEGKQNDLAQLQQEIQTAPENSENSTLLPIYQDVEKEIMSEEAMEGLAEEDKEALLASYDVSYDSQTIQGTCDLGKDKSAEIAVFKYDNAYSNYAEFYNTSSTERLFTPPLSDVFTTCINDDLNNTKNLNISLEDAKAQALNLINQIGIQNMTLSSTSVISKANALDYIDDWPDAYRFIFTKEVNNIQVTYETTDIIIEDAYDVPWGYEYIEICVDDSGIIKFYWNAPSEIKEVLAENVELLPFSEIQDIFNGYILIKTSLDNNVVKTDIVIDEVKLGLMRVKSTQSETGYMLIPVWDFFGYRTNTYDENSQLILDENNQYSIDEYGHSYLTINALDGSIIDRSLGY